MLLEGTYGSFLSFGYSRLIGSWLVIEVLWAIVLFSSFGIHVSLCFLTLVQQMVHLGVFQNK